MPRISPERIEAARRLIIAESNRHSLVVRLRASGVEIRDLISEDIVKIILDLLGIPECEAYGEPILQRSPRRQYADAVWDAIKGNPHEWNAWMLNPPYKISEDLEEIIEEIVKNTKKIGMRDPLKEYEP